MKDILILCFIFMLINFEQKLFLGGDFFEKLTS